MFKTAAVIGKFYPFHLGHKHLIDVAQAGTKELYILVCWNKKESIPELIRYNWLKSSYPNARVMLVEDRDYPQNNSKFWAKKTKEWLGFIPEAVFTSEEYGDAWAKYLGCKHVRVDQSRVKIPISGTKLRQSPYKNWEYMLPEVRSYFVKKICLVGAESTGKSTLSIDLAKHYKTTWVPEYGRLHWEARLPKKELFKWGEEDFVKICKEQNKLEDELKKEANKVLICDTNAFATSIWFERYMGYRSRAVEEFAKNREPDLYILTDVKTPFKNDGTRDGEHIREWMHKRFVQELKKKKIPYVIVEGSRVKRLKKAVRFIDRLMV